MTALRDYGVTDVAGDLFLELCRHIETNPRGICASRLVVLNPQWSYS